MEKRINDAFNNIDVVIAQARMTRQEHAQLMTDMKFIREQLVNTGAKKEVKPE